MTVKNKAKDTQESKLEMISFRVDPSIMKQIRDYAKTLTQAEGQPQSEAQAARRLMMLSLNAWLEKK